MCLKGGAKLEYTLTFSNFTFLEMQRAYTGSE